MRFRIHLIFFVSLTLGVGVHAPAQSSSVHSMQQGRRACRSKPTAAKAERWKLSVSPRAAGHIASMLWARSDGNFRSLTGRRASPFYEAAALVKLEDFTGDGNPDILARGLSSGASALTSESIYVYDPVSGQPAGRRDLPERWRRPAGRDRAGAACVITVNDFTAAEDFTEAALVVSSLGDPGGGTTVLANRSPATPGAWITLSDLASVLHPKSSARLRAGAARRPTQGAVMATASLADVELVVRTIAQIAVDNEKYFGDLDAVVGDGDFGYSMARGFEMVLRGLGRLRPRRHRHVPEEGRGRHHQPDRRHVRPDLGHGVPAAPARPPGLGRAGRRAGRRDAAGADRGDQGARQVRGGGQDAARRAGAGGGRARGAARPGRDAAATLRAAAATARESGRGDPDHAGQARAGQLHRRAQHRLRSTPAPSPSP